MKVLYVDIETNGHHQTYLRALMNIPGKENILVIPEQLSEFKCKQYVFNKIDFYNKKFTAYLGWIKEVREIINKEKPDVIHFLYGDVFYKYFGIGLEGLRHQCKVINTVHALKKGKVGLLSLKRILRLSDYGVFHTEAIVTEVRNFGISNVVHIEYPQFSTGYEVNADYAKRYFGIETKSPVLGCIGGTRYDKGLDILLYALKNVNSNFELLIAGAEDAIKLEEIKKISEPYTEKVHLMLKYLTDEELEMAFQASDIIVIPYRKTFNGASGPLGEGVGKMKMIVGCSHGSIGNIIKTNHLGLTFQSEEVKDLSRVLNEALNMKFTYDESAITYMKSLSVDSFMNSYERLYECD